MPQQPSDMLWLKVTNSSMHGNVPVKLSICTHDYYKNTKSQRQMEAVVTLENYV